MLCWRPCLQENKYQELRYDTIKETQVVGLSDADFIIIILN